MCWVFVFRCVLFVSIEQSLGNERFSRSIVCFIRVLTGLHACKRLNSVIAIALLFCAFRFTFLIIVECTALHRKSGDFDVAQMKNWSTKRTKKIEKLTGTDLCVCVAFLSPQFPLKPTSPLFIHDYSIFHHIALLIFNEF